MTMKTALFGSLKRQLVLVAVAASVAAPALMSVGIRGAAACDLGDLYLYGCDRPGTPQNLTVAPRYADTVELHWDHQDGHWGELTANVRISENGVDKPAYVARPFPGESVYISKLSYGTNYCFSVLLKGDNNLTSDYSQWACIKTGYPPLSDPTAPAPVPPSGINPFNLHLVASDTAYVEIGWNYTASKPDYFSIYRDGKPAGTVQPFATQQYLYTDVFTAALEHTYTYKVCAAFSRGDLGPIENCTEAAVKTGLNLTSVLSSTTVQLNGSSAIQAALGLPLVTPTPPPPGH